MSKVPLQVPKSVKVTGALYSPSNVCDLTQDMLQLELPNGLFIDVGWYPELDPCGTYMILVFRNSIDHVLKRIRSKDHLFIARQVEALLVSFLTPTQTVVGSTFNWLPGRGILARTESMALANG